MENNSDAEYPRILVVSNNAFSETSNNGKTLASFFKSYPSSNIAQLYFNQELPNDNHYSKYFRITDIEMSKRILKKNNPGKIISYSELGVNNEKTNNPTVIFSNIKRNNLFRLAREMLWMNERWKTNILNKWLDDFEPEIVFLCAGDTGFAYDISEYIKKKYQTKLIIYITDDYIMPRKTISPFWWLRRNYIYKKMEKNINESDLFITISKEMRKSYQKIFGVDSITAMNISETMKLPERQQVRRENEKIVFVYVGGLHFNRYETLNLLAQAIKEFNSKSKQKKAFLEIYSGSQLNKKIEKKLNVTGASKYCGNLNQEEVKKILNSCDFPVHVESFDRRSIESTRLSISTKIPEYLSLGKPILAIGPYEVASIKYLDDSAFCIIKPEEIYNGLKELIQNKDLKYDLSQKALIKFGENHNSEKVLKDLNKNIFKILNK